MFRISIGKDVAASVMFAVGWPTTKLYPSIFLSFSACGHSPTVKTPRYPSFETSKPFALKTSSVLTSLPLPGFPTLYFLPANEERSLVRPLSFATTNARSSG